MKIIIVFNLEINAVFKGKNLCVSHLLLYAKACSVYDQYLNCCRLLTHWLMLHGFQLLV